MTYRRRLYISAIIKQNHLKNYMLGNLGGTHAHDFFKVISSNYDSLCMTKDKAVKNKITLNI